MSTHRPVRRAVAFAAVCLSLALLLVAAPSALVGFNQSSAEATLWQLLNGARTNNGLAPLQSHGTLVNLARWRSSDMLQRNYFSHTIAGCGCLVYTHYERNGIAYDWAGENIGWNSGLDDSYSPVRVHEKFMASPGHRVNVLDPRFTHGGVGAAAADNALFAGFVQNTRMYTELFLQPPTAARPASAPAPAAPAAPGAPAPAPVAQPATATPAPTSAPKPMRVEAADPVRPVSDAIDGVSETVRSKYAPSPYRGGFYPL